MLRPLHALSFAAAMLAATGALAEDAPPAAPTGEPAPEALIETLMIDDLAALLAEIGAEEVSVVKEEKTVRFKSGNRNFFVTLGACDEATGACAIATVGRAVKARLPLEVLNKLNDAYAGLITATRINEDTFKMVRGVIFGGGISRTNLSVNIVWYVKQSPEFEKLITSQVVAGSQEPQNAAGKLALGEIVLTPEEIGKLIEQVNLPKKGAPLSLPKNQ